MRRQIYIFVGLMIAVVVAAVALSLYRYYSQAPFREVWVGVVQRLDAQQVRIDSLSAELGALDSLVEKEKAELQRLGEEIAGFEERATSGRLPSPEYRRYLGVIDSHNEVVEAHNERVIDMRDTYAEYSTLIDTHNALVDSANELQRTAVQEGIQLPRRESVR